MVGRINGRDSPITEEGEAMNKKTEIQLISELIAGETERIAYFDSLLQENYGMKPEIAEEVNALKHGSLENAQKLIILMTQVVVGVQNYDDDGSAFMQGELNYVKKPEEGDENAEA